MISGKLLLFTAVISVFFTVCQKTPRAVPVVIPRIISVIPHDTSAFTQGLFYKEGKLYESTGLYGKSSLRAVDAVSGVIEKNTPVETVFAEGCAPMDSMLVQITWQDQKAFVYSLRELKKQRTMVYAGEGWGLTSHQEYFYMSTGSDTIFVRNQDFTVMRTIPVMLSGRPVARLNELEYVNGFIYANVWYSNEIMEINPKTGAVTRIIDCSSIVAAESPSSESAVLNGIAHNPQTGRFYLTGKNWKNIFIVEIPKQM